MTETLINTSILLSSDVKIKFDSIENKELYLTAQLNIDHPNDKYIEYLIMNYLLKYCQVTYMNIRNKEIKENMKYVYYELSCK